MSFLDKLFGAGTDKKVEKTAKGVIKDFDDVFNGLAKAVEGKNENKPEEPAPEAPAAPAAPDTAPNYDAPSGFSWGEYMPAEENQYNFGGTYHEYFEKIFREELPDLPYEKKTVGYYGRNTAYTFKRDGRTVLVVELMTEKSSSKMTRNECEANGIPYVRFYFDHEGWWNTRAYVVARIKNAL